MKDAVANTCNVHTFGKGPFNSLVRVTGRWFKKCAMCRSRKAYSAMVRCVGCRVLAHERCVNWQSHDDEVVQKVLRCRAAGLVDAATNTATAATVDMATNKETVTTAAVATYTEPAAVVDMANNMELAVTTVAKATNTDPRSSANMSTNTDEVEAIGCAGDGVTTNTSQDEGSSMIDRSPKQETEKMTITPVHVPSMNQSVIDEYVQSVFSKDALGTRLRRSKNPSVLGLKQTDAIVITVPSNVCLVQRIVEEEGLESHYKVHTNTTLSTTHGVTAVQLKISPGEFMVIGFGDSVYEAHEDAALECLIRFKSMLKLERFKLITSDTQ